MENLKISAINRNRVIVRCRKCKKEACSGSDIFKIGDPASHYVVPGAFMKNRLIKKPHHKPGRIPDCPSIIKTHKIYCKNCESDWGVMCNLVHEGREFPVLKCMSFSFQEDGCCPVFVSQWSKARFEILPIELWFSDNAE